MRAHRTFWPLIVRRLQYRANARVSLSHAATERPLEAIGLNADALELFRQDQENRQGIFSRPVKVVQVSLSRDIVG